MNGEIIIVFSFSFISFLLGVAFRDFTVGKSVNKILNPNKKYPEPGTKWEFSPNEVDPFLDKRTIEVEVKAVKSGYVNYRWLNTDWFQNESMKLDTFMYVYKPTTEQAKP